MVVSDGCTSMHKGCLCLVMIYLHSACHGLFPAINSVHSFTETPKMTLRNIQKWLTWLNMFLFLPTFKCSVENLLDILLLTRWFKWKMFRLSKREARASGWGRCLLIMIWHQPVSGGLCAAYLAFSRSQCLSLWRLRKWREILGSLRWCQDQMPSSPYSEWCPCQAHTCKDWLLVISLRTTVLLASVVLQNIQRELENL